MGEQQKYSDIISEIDANYKKMKCVRPIPVAAIKRYKDVRNILSS